MTTATNADDVWRILRELAASQKETDRRMQETDQRMQETDRQIKETSRSVKELGKQIGGLGAKFGSFTEGLALPSMDKILRQQFCMEVISPSVCGLVKVVNTLR